MTSDQTQNRDFRLVQLTFFGGFAVAFLFASHESLDVVRAAVTATPLATVVQVERTRPLQIKPLYDDPEIVREAAHCTLNGTRNDRRQPWHWGIQGNRIGPSNRGTRFRVPRLDRNSKRNPPAAMPMDPRFP